MKVYTKGVFGSPPAPRFSKFWSGAEPNEISPRSYLREVSIDCSVKIWSEEDPAPKKSESGDPLYYSRNATAKDNGSLSHAKENDSTHDSQASLGISPLDRHLGPTRSSNCSQPKIAMGS